MKKLAKAILKKNLGEYFKSALNIIKLNRQSISEISTDENATKLAIVIVLISGFISALLSILIYGSTMQFIQGMFSWFTLISTPILSLISLFLWVGILHLISKIFRSSGEYIGLFRVLGFANLLVIFTGIPLIGFLALIWTLVVTVVALSEIENLTMGKAFLVILIPAIVLLVIFITIAAMFINSPFNFIA